MTLWPFLQINTRLKSESYTPRTWRTHSLHICPPEPYSPSDPQTKLVFNWIFLISSLNFSFWSEREGHSDRYGVEWRTGWGEDSRTVHTGYWSLVAAIDRGEYLSSTSKGCSCSSYMLSHPLAPFAIKMYYHVPTYAELVTSISFRTRDPNHRPRLLCLRDSLPRLHHRTHISSCTTMQRNNPSTKRAHRDPARKWLNPL